eukprot:jgi/Ulvmu1/442/UM001_0449.1
MILAQQAAAMLPLHFQIGQPRCRALASARSSCRPSAEAESYYSRGQVTGRHSHGAHIKRTIPAAPRLDLRLWREFRSNLVNKERQEQVVAQRSHLACSATAKYWCHRLPQVEPGCLILANQAGMGFYEKAVVLVVSHTSHRSIGLMLNRTAGVKIEDLAVDKDLHRLFGHRSLRLGGCMNHDSLHIFHADPKIANSHEMCPGMFTGGLQSAISLMSSGATDPDQCALICGSMHWVSDQLDQDVANGTWLPVSACSQLVIDISCCDEGSRTAWHDILAMTSEPDRVYR